MEPEGSLPCLQQPTTGPYPDLDESNSHLPPYLPDILSNIIAHLRLGLPRVLFHLGFPNKILYGFLISPMRANAPTISSSLTW